MEKRLLSIKEIGAYLNISPQTIRNRLSAGTFPIPPIKIGGKLLWDRRKVDRFLDEARPRN
jgi:predicted DNA-binding transcriptional regulator AlpA